MEKKLDNDNKEIEFEKEKNHKIDINNLENKYKLKSKNINNTFEEDLKKLDNDNKEI